MRKTTRAALIAIITCMALAGCGGASDQSTPAMAATGTACSEESSDGIMECVVTLSGTRQVDCVVYAWGKQGGMSCDWDHVSGADKEPKQ